VGAIVILHAISRPVIVERIRKQPPKVMATDGFLDEKEQSDDDDDDDGVEEVHFYSQEQDSTIVPPKSRKYSHRSDNINSKKKQVVGVRMISDLNDVGGNVSYIDDVSPALLDLSPMAESRSSAAPTPIFDVPSYEHKTSSSHCYKRR
jgi:hypothetical protein